MLHLEKSKHSGSKSISSSDDEFVVIEGNIEDSYNAKKSMPKAKNKGVLAKIKTTGTGLFNKTKNKGKQSKCEMVLGIICYL